MANDAGAGAVPIPDLGPAGPHHPDPDDYAASGDPIITEAQRRFKRCQAWESNSRKLFLEDIKFANADADNGYQWPNAIRRNRDVDERPCLTINKTRQHCLLIQNDAKQNKPEIRVRPTGGGATREAADAWMALMRHIDYISSATVAYDMATKFQVQGGIGYWRVITDYAREDTFDQEIYIQGIKDPLSVYLDPDIKQPDGLDAKFAFVFDDIPKEFFRDKYPEFADRMVSSTLNSTASGSDWVKDDHVRVAEYWRVTHESDTLVSFVNGGDRLTLRRSHMTADQFTSVKSHPLTRTRQIAVPRVEWHLLIGDEVAKTRTWAGRFIPIIRLVGEETEIDSQLDRKGHTRAMKDPQRMYNYWSSSAVEFVALQGKTPWVGPAKAFEGFEEYWKTANRVNHAFLPYEDWDEELQRAIPAPTRPNPPTMAQAYLQGMQVAGQELMMVSGQYQNQMGEPGNERTGRAIQERQRQGDKATYHFIDGLAIAIRATGRVILDLAPHIYDVAQTKQILAEDGTSLELRIDPAAKQAYAQTLDEEGRVIGRVLNPRLGQYEVMADVGPAYATKREEAFNALVQIITQAPNLVNVIGDIMLKAADFPMAEEASERLKRMVPPQALGQGPSHAESELQQKVQELTGTLSKVMQELAAEKLKLKGKDQLRDIDVYKAQTDRFAAFAKAHELDPGEVKTTVHELVQEALQTHLVPILQANQSGTAEQGGAGGADASASGAATPAPPDAAPAPPVPGARMAPDGKHYLPDPTRPGKFLQVV